MPATPVSRDAPFGERLEYFYTHFDLVQPDNLAAVAAKFEANEPALNKALNAKYGVDVASVYDPKAELCCTWAMVQSASATIKEDTKSGYLTKRIKGKRGGGIKWHQRSVHVDAEVITIQKGEVVQGELVLRTSSVGEHKKEKGRPYCFSIQVHRKSSPNKLLLSDPPRPPHLPTVPTHRALRSPPPPPRTALPHHRTTAPPHHRTTAPPHHRTTAPPPQHHRTPPAVLAARHRGGDLRRRVLPRLPRLDLHHLPLHPGT
jgi:hypothetical protein